MVANEDAKNVRRCECSLNRRMSAGLRLLVKSGGLEMFRASAKAATAAALVATDDIL